MAATRHAKTGRVYTRGTKLWGEVVLDCASGLLPAEGGGEILIRPNSGLEKQNFMIDHSNHIRFPGQETTATNLTSTLMYLHRNPKWKKAAALEAEQVLGSKDNVDYSDLTKLPTVSNCLKEALRLAPPAFIIGVVEPTEDVVIPHDKEWMPRDADAA